MSSQKKKQKSSSSLDLSSENSESFPERYLKCTSKKQDTFPGLKNTKEFLKNTISKSSLKKKQEISLVVTDENTKSKRKNEKLTINESECVAKQRKQRLSPTPENRNNRENHQRSHSRSSSFDHANARWGLKNDDKKFDKEEKQKQNFYLSGKLTEERNTCHSVVIKYSEPPEACKPKRRWRLYPFKGTKALPTLYIHRESAYLIGRDRKVVDLPVDHPSCSKQHAVFQYRLVPFTQEDGTTGKRVKPYLIDLDSPNGTYINNERIEARKYFELFEEDVIRFGYSSREYILLHDNSKDKTKEDDVMQGVKREDI